MKIDSLIIYSVFHKLHPIVENSLIVPILTSGLYHYAKALGFKTDNSNNNISELNYSFSELTVLYWIWKNDKTSQYIGLFHYRRYLDLKNNPTLYRSKYNGVIYYHVTMKEVINIYNEISIKDVEDQLNGFDLIMPDYFYMQTSVNNQYCFSHSTEDWLIMYDCLRLRYPDYYITGITLFEEKRIIPCNIFITSRILFNQIMEWLFPLLLDIHAKINYDKRTNYQKRAISFISERLLTLYVVHNKLLINTLPLLFIDWKLADIDLPKTEKSK